VLCRQKAAMAGNDLAIIGDQERCREAEIDQRGSDFRDLIVRMVARVVRVRLQARVRQKLDLVRAGNGARSSVILEAASEYGAGRDDRRFGNHLPRHHGDASKLT
jgi:hypothetical protein